MCWRRRRPIGGGIPIARREKCRSRRTDGPARDNGSCEKDRARAIHKRSQGQVIWLRRRGSIRRRLNLEFIRHSMPIESLLRMRIDCPDTQAGSKCIRGMKTLRVYGPSLTERRCRGWICTEIGIAYADLMPLIAHHRGFAGRKWNVPSAARITAFNGASHHTDAEPALRASS